jgi:hypothetical protein
MEKGLELEERIKKNLILHYTCCKYGIKAGLSKKAYEELKKNKKI